MQAADIEVAATAAGQAEEDQDQGQKYVKRTSSVTRAVQRALPSLFQPRLPVTSRCYDLSGAVLRMPAGTYVCRALMCTLLSMMHRGRR